MKKLNLFIAFALSMSGTLAFAADLNDKDARQFAKIMETAGVKPIDLQFFKFVSGYALTCDVSGTPNRCEISLTRMDPAVTRRSIAFHDVAPLITLLDKAGFKPSDSQTANGTAGRSFIQINSADCEMNKAGEDFYASCRLE